ncbi:maleylacetoacetate isomerase [Cupriavidus consociatus]|uniref:maleylacetoacetate isomerase n=1 Tax=Cupriavidus consociatus TaxID=2821357 RepID=UPI001AE59CEC|nr:MULTISPECIES: maleylacetoacetate isomerase [unclassified Cupriavidus]MBP0620606.1 maleylacetoacetate isomerase [Cupriavidus sp. LEh25]MDK2657266.1 maleylacetoacetate isomerase [Cupriavidus sp. LEh21]
MQLYSFFNSSTSYRVRIALALKGLPYDYLGVNIRTGQHRVAEYVDGINPSASVPALVDGDFTLGQSLAIIDYLDARHPEPRLLPQDPVQRARVLELSMLIGCDIHPVNNLRVLRYLQDTLKVTPGQKDAWYRHWIDEGMAGVERLLARQGHGNWCFGDAPTLADVALVPQVANALRMGCDLGRYERAMAVYAHASAHPAFAQAAPARQPDYTA